MLHIYRKISQDLRKCLLRGRPAFESIREKPGGLFPFWDYGLPQDHKMYFFVQIEVKKGIIAGLGEGI